MKLLGENDTEAVLQRLDRLNHEEARTTAAQTLEVVYGLMKNMKLVIDGAWHVSSLRSPNRMLNLYLRRSDIKRRCSTSPKCAHYAIEYLGLLTLSTSCYAADRKQHKQVSTFAASLYLYILISADQPDGGL